MNTERLERALVVMQEIADNEHPYVDITSADAPDCTTPGCHAGLWWLTLKQLGVEVKDYYEYMTVARRVLVWLEIPYIQTANVPEFEPEPILDCWPYGREKAKGMFCCQLAFGEKKFVFPSQVIIDTWRQALNNYMEQTT